MLFFHLQVILPSFLMLFLSPLPTTRVSHICFHWSSPKTLCSDSWAQRMWKPTHTKLKVTKDLLCWGLFLDITKIIPALQSILSRGHILSVIDKLQRNLPTRCSWRCPCIVASYVSLTLPLPRECFSYHLCLVGIGVCLDTGH